MEGKSLFSTSFDIHFLLKSMVSGEKVVIVTPDDPKVGPITYHIIVTGVTKLTPNNYCFVGKRIYSGCSAGGWPEIFECTGTFENNGDKGAGIIEFGKSLGWPE